MSEQDHLAGLRILENYQQNNRTREDRELITQMNRLKANDIIKGMEVDAEVHNFLDYAKKDAEALDKTHPGYASQLMGIANTRMSDLSPAAYEKARKQIEAENDQRATTTDYRAMFGEAPTGISYQDSKFAMKAKDAFGVDPVFAEKDGIRIFDRKGTEALVNGVVIKRAQFKGETEGEGDVAKAEVVRNQNELIALAASDVAVGKVIDEHFKKPILMPESVSKRLTILEFNKAFRHDMFPLQEDGQPDYAAGHKMVEDKNLATMKAVAEAKSGPAAVSNPSEKERMAFGFGKVMENSINIIDSLPAGSQPGAWSKAFSVVPGVGGSTARAFQSPETQKYQNAALAWTDAVLRFESGGAITEPEIKAKVGTYFPQIGDKPEVIEQKRQLRALSTENMKTSAGRMNKGDGAGGSSSIKVENGVLQAPSRAAAEAYLAANPNAGVKMLKIGKDYFEVKKTP